MYIALSNCALAPAGSIRGAARWVTVGDCPHDECYDIGALLDEIEFQSHSAQMYHSPLETVEEYQNVSSQLYSQKSNHHLARE